MGTNSAPATQFSNTFLYIDDLFSVNNEDEFGNDFNTIYPSELELKDTSTSQRMCVTSTQGSSVTTTHLSMSASTIRYDKRDDFTFRIANFPYVDSNISTKPAYSVHLACEQALLFGRAKRAARERASERRVLFTISPKWRAFSQASVHQHITAGEIYARICTSKLDFVKRLCRL